MNVTEGSDAEQSVTATDADGQSLHFFKLDGPDYLSVATTVPGAGSAAGQIRLRPGFIDAGTARATLGVNDGIAGARRHFSVTVADAVRPPSFAWAHVDSASLGTAEDPSVTVMADLNGDGVNDLVVGHTNTGMVSVYLGDGGSAFHLKVEFTPVPSTLATLSVGDFTGDSRPDLVLTNPGRGFLMAGFGDGTFGAIVPFLAGIEPYSSDAGDLDGDGVADLVVGNFGAGTISVLRADGLGGFSAPATHSVGGSPIDLELADLNLDGKLDIVVANYGGGVSVLLGDGAGSFTADTNYPVAQNLLSLAVGDLNGDDFPEIVTASTYSDSITVLIGVGAGLFQEGPGFPGIGSPLSIRDFNADGRADLAMTTLGGILILPGNGAGGFETGILTAAGLGRPSEPVLGAAIDLNEDGAADLVLPDRDRGRIMVLLSDPQAGRAFAARAFPSKSGPIQIGGGGPPFTCVSVEPLAGAYENSDVNLSSLSMTSVGTGDVEVIHANFGRTQIVGDTDGNGVAEIQACFSRDDLRHLFNGLTGKSAVSVTIEGALNTGGLLRAALDLRLKTPAARAASVFPSPANPAATLTFETKGAGAVQVRLFDLRGRLVRTVLLDPRMDAGVHSIRVDGLDDAGSPLASGVYFYHIESPERVERGRITVLK